MTHAELPRSSERHPPTGMLSRLRPAAARVVRSWYDVRVLGGSNLPAGGGARPRAR